MSILNPQDPDYGKDPSYIRRRNILLDQMKRTNWDDSEEEIKPKKPKKDFTPKPIKPDLSKSRNKFFKF